MIKNHIFASKSIHSKSRHKGVLSLSLALASVSTLNAIDIKDKTYGDPYTNSGDTTASGNNLFNMSFTNEQGATFTNNGTLTFNGTWNNKGTFTNIQVAHQNLKVGLTQGHL